VPWSASDTHASPRARSSRGTSNDRQASNFRASLTLAFARQRIAARRGSQSAYKASQRRAIAMSAFKFTASVAVSNSPL
jgi:hypothetical protein